MVSGIHALLLCEAYQGVANESRVWLLFEERHIIKPLPNERLRDSPRGEKTIVANKPSLINSDGRPDYGDPWFPLVPQSLLSVYIRD